MKVLVSLDDDLLRRIDSAARASHMSRSAYLSRLAERELAAAAPRRRGTTRRALRRLDDLAARQSHTTDSTTGVRAGRDAR